MAGGVFFSGSAFFESFPSSVSASSFSSSRALLLRSSFFFSLAANLVALGEAFGVPSLFSIFGSVDRLVSLVFAEMFDLPDTLDFDEVDDFTETFDFSEAVDFTDLMEDLLPFFPADFCDIPEILLLGGGGIMVLSCGVDIALEIFGFGKVFTFGGPAFDDADLVDPRDTTDLDLVISACSDGVTSPLSSNSPMEFDSPDIF